MRYVDNDVTADFRNAKLFAQTLVDAADMLEHALRIHDVEGFVLEAEFAQIVIVECDAHAFCRSPFANDASRDLGAIVCERRRAEFCKIDDIAT